MNKKITYLIWIILLIITICSLYFAYKYSKNVSVTQKQSNMFMDDISQCPDTNTSDRYVCLHNLAETTNKEADALADKLITQAPIRLKEITTTQTGPTSFVYGGRDFLTDLPIQVEKVQKAKDEYINSVCNLDSMKIYGGSGMDLEIEACRYHFTNEYLQILKDLESGLIAEE